MSTLTRKILFCAIGLLAGIAAWPLAEIVLVYQSNFPSYLIFSISVGIVLGAFMGGFFGTIDAITLSAKPRIVSGITTGFFIGAVGGAIGYLAGQGALFIIAENLFHSNASLQSTGIPISRAFGWAVLGVFIGSIEGVRSRSMAKLRVGILGGLLGGLLGGMALEYFKIHLPGILFARLSGLLILGLLIGLCYSIFEKGFSRGVLKLLNGKLKGKEYLILQKSTKIGKSPQSDIYLEDYADVDDTHAEIHAAKGKIVLKNQQTKASVKVNEDVIEEYPLRFEDVVQIGSAKFLFYYT